MNLTDEEKEFIKEWETRVASILSSINIATQFKAGDYLIAFHGSYSDDPFKTKRPVINSYGAVKKFQVVAVDANGIPYMKELNKNSKPFGQLISSIEYDYMENFRPAMNFEIDPDYADAIILDNQNNFNASGIIKEKSDIFKEISRYNKSIKIKTDSKVLPAFLATVKVGDVLWRSNISSWSVTEINALPRNITTNRIGYSTPFMKVINNKGQELDICFNDISDRALYTARPRTYKELKDPK